MKIIGKGNDSFILTATRDEVANLKGFYSYFDKDIKMEVGDDVNVTEIYRKYRDLESLLKTDQFQNALKILTNAVSIITPIKELFVQTKNQLNL